MVNHDFVNFQKEDHALDTCRFTKTVSIWEEDIEEHNLIDTVYHKGLDIVICIFHPACILVFSGNPTCIRYAKENLLRENGSRAIDTYSGDENQEVLSHWYARDEKEKQLVSRVGSFTCCSVAEEGPFCFVGSENGCLIIFSITKTGIDEEPHHTGEVVEATLLPRHGGISLRPFLWSDVAGLIDFPDVSPEENLTAISCLHGHIVHDDLEHYVVIAFLASCYIAVLEFDTENGVTPVDVLNLPSTATKIVVAQGTLWGAVWVLNLGVYGPEAVFFLQATPSSVMLLSSLSIDVLRETMPEDGHHLCSTESEPGLLELAFSSPTHRFCELYIVLCIGCGANVSSVVLVTFNYLTLYTTRKKITINGVVLGLSFIIDGFPQIHVKDTVSMFPFSMSCLLLITVDHIFLFRVPDLQFFAPVASPFAKQLQETSSTDIHHVSPTLTRMESGLKRRVHCCSAVPSQRVLQRWIQSHDAREAMALHIRTSLAVLMMEGSKPGTVSGLWLTRKYCHQRRPGGTQPHQLMASVLSTSSDLQENTLGIKQQMEILIEKARQDPLGNHVDPIMIINTLKQLLSSPPSLSQHTSSFRNLLSYIVKIAKMTPFRTFDETKTFLMSIFSLLVNAESANLPSTQTVKFSQAIQRVLFRLVTYGLLSRVESQHLANATQKDAEAEEEANRDIWMYNAEEPQESTVTGVQWTVNDAFDWLSWNRFLHADLTKLCCHFANDTDITKLFIVLNRHLYDMEEDVTVRSEKLLKILKNLPTKLPFMYLEEFLAKWLRHHIVMVVKDNTQFLDWVGSRALALEAVWNSPIPSLKFLSCVFPEYMTPSEAHDGVTKTIESSLAVEELSEEQVDPLTYGGTLPLPMVSTPLLPKLFVTLCKFWSGSGSVLGNLSSTPFPLSHSSSYHQSQLHRLTRIYCLLLECAHIQTRHELSVSFTALEQGKIWWSDVAYALLNRVRLPELLEDEIRLHVKPFCDSHNLQLEELLMSYIYDVVAEIDQDLLTSGDNNVASRIKERELRVVALLHCLRTDHAKAQGVLWLLHAWSPAASLASLDTLGLGPLFEDLKKSRALLGNPILQELQSAIILRELQGLLRKYNLRAALMAFTKPTEAAFLITHLACLISWKTVSFNDALTAVRLLFPYIGRTVDEVHVAVLRLQTLVSLSNRRLLSHIAHGLHHKIFTVTADPSRGILWTWKGYETWENSWRPALLQEIKETVLAQLSATHVAALASRFTGYVFTLLDDAAMTLKAKVLPDQPHITMDLCHTAAQAIVATLVALFLEQHVTATSVKCTMRYKSVQDPRKFMERHPFWPQKHSRGLEDAACSLHPNENLHCLQSCERLRREFGVFVKPRDITLSRVHFNQKQYNAFISNTATHSSRHRYRNSLMSRWQLTLHTESLKRSRNIFLHIGKHHIQDVIQTFWKNETNLDKGPTSNERSDIPSVTDTLLKVHEPTFLSEYQGMRLTQLLQFGVLMGVGESFVRHQCIVKPSTSSTLQLDSMSLGRLLVDIKRNSSSQNALDVINMLKDFLRDLQQRAQDVRNSIAVLVLLSQVLDIAAHCLVSLPDDHLRNGVRLVADVLLALQLLVQSDLIDTAPDIVKNDKALRYSCRSTQSIECSAGSDVCHFALQCSPVSRVFLPSLYEHSCVVRHQDTEFDNKVPSQPPQQTTLLPQLSTKRITGLFNARFHNVSALYKKEEALADALNFLVLRHDKTAQAATEDIVPQDLQSHVACIIKKLLDLESYELALSFLLKFPDPTHTRSNVKQAAARLLSNVIFSRSSFDFELGVGLSLILSAAEVWSRFLDALPTLRDVSRIMFYSRLVLDVGFLFQTPYLVKNTVQVWIRAKWRERLDLMECHYDIKRFQEVQQHDCVRSNSYQVELLPHFICISGMNLPLARVFALDFDIPEKELLCCWLKLVLVDLPFLHQSTCGSSTGLWQNGAPLSPTPNALASMDTHWAAHKDIPFSRRTTLELYQSYRQLMLPVLYSLPPMTVEQIIENDCLPHISPYDYDSLELLLGFIKHKPAARASLMVLRHIYSYNRSDTPSEEELCNWGKSRLRPMSVVEQKLQKKRLPFHALLQNPWRVLGPLISDSTINTFMPLYSLKLCRDDFQLQLLWNFVEDVGETKGNTVGFLRGSRWTFPNVTTKNTSTVEGQQSFFFSEELFIIQTKLQSLCDECYAVNPRRTLATTLLLLEQPNLLPLGQLQVAIAEWTALHLTKVEGETQPTSRFSVHMTEALPPYIHEDLRMTLRQLGFPVDAAKNSSESQHERWILTRTQEEAQREAGALRSRWTLIEAGLGAFAELLPNCSLLCIHALYYYLAPILLRPSFVGLYNEEQLRVFMNLSEHPFLQNPSNATSHLYLMHPLTPNDQPPSNGSTEPQGPHTTPPPHFSKSIHTLVDIICLGCNLNPKVVRVLLLRRLIKAPCWTPLHVISLLEKNLPVYKEQDIIALIGCVPTMDMLTKAKEILVHIESSNLTAGFQEKWFQPFNSFHTPLSSSIQKSPKMNLTFGQSVIEIISMQRQCLIVLGMDRRTFIKLTLEIALKNERALCTSSRTLHLLYSAESTETVHAVYKEIPEKIMEFWIHSLYLDVLDALGIASQLGNFIKADKAGLALAFYRQSRSASQENLHGDLLFAEVYRLVLIACLCLDFHVPHWHLLGRVMTQLLGIARMNTLRLYDASRNASTTLHNNTLDFITPSVAQGFPFGKYIKAILCTVFAHPHFYDTAFISVLDSLLEAPAVDLLDFLKRITQGTLSNITLQHPLLDILPAMHWFFLTPAFLHRSSFLHLHCTTEIALKYLEIVHFLAQLSCDGPHTVNSPGLINNTPSSPMDQHESLCHLVPQCAISCSDVRQLTLCVLHQIVHVCHSNVYFLDYLLKAFDLEWLFNGSRCQFHATTQSTCEPQISEELQEFLTVVKVQVICAAVAYQCLDNAFESPRSREECLRRLVSSCFGSFGILLLLISSRKCFERTRRDLVNFLAEVLNPSSISPIIYRSFLVYCVVQVIVRNVQCVSQIPRLLRLMEHPLRECYIRTLSEKAFSLSLPLHDVLLPFVPYASDTMSRNSSI